MLAKVQVVRFRTCLRMKRIKLMPNNSLSLSLSISLSLSLSCEAVVQLVSCGAAPGESGARIFSAGNQFLRTCMSGR
jgi:hypothetical protein